MCGIAGYYGKRELSPEVITTCGARMDRRGPDAYGARTFTLRNGGHCYLLHSRLSIIDPKDRSEQPMRRGDTTIVFNGEIYNYQALRRRYAQRLTTESDTEVFVCHIDEHGEKGFADLEGMWSLAAFNHLDETLLLSRDRFGEKPLYVDIYPDGVYFGSEIAYLSILKEAAFSIRKNQIRRFLVNGYKSLHKQDSCAFFEEIEEVWAGTWQHFQFTPQGLDRVIDHYSSDGRYPEPLPSSAMSFEQAVKGTRSLLTVVVGKRLQADVPVAFCLSAGIDSTSIMSIAKKQYDHPVMGFHSFVSDPRYNEVADVNRFESELGISSIHYKVEQETSLARLREVIRWRCAPILTSTFWAQHLLMEQVRKHGFKVILNGHAADELFCGYYDHPLWQIADLKAAMGRATHNRSEYLATCMVKIREWEKTFGQFVRNPLLKEPTYFIGHPGARDYIYLDSDKFSNYLHDNFNEPHREEHIYDSLLRNRNWNELYRETTPPILHEDDLGAMYWGVENRSPFLDSDLVRFAFSIPVEYLIQGGMGKAVLREAMRGIVPDFILDNPRKIGWNAGIEDMFDLPAVREELLADSPIFDIVKRESITWLLNSPQPYDNATSKFLWAFINSKIFMEEFSS